MSHQEEPKTEVTDEELEQQEGEPLPDREAMSIITPGYEMPVPVDDLPHPIEPNPGPLKE